MRRKFLFNWLNMLLLGLPLLLLACDSQPNLLRLATTTTTYDSGLMDALLPLFEARTNAEVDVIAVGTGEALALGQAGDVDVLLVHAPELEEPFVQANFGLARHKVMFNDFVLVGPAADPAETAVSADIVAALTQIATAEAPFISRGDNSGTHVREQTLWRVAGITPAGDWYQSVGQGMGATLNIAAEQQAYTLSDRATFVAQQQQGLSLALLLAGDDRLFNQYSVIIVNPALHDDINFELADDFVAWLTGSEGQTAIDNYRVGGQQLFFANAGEQP